MNDLWQFGSRVAQIFVRGVSGVAHNLHLVHEAVSPPV